MKKTLPAFIRNLLLSALILLGSFSSRASHIVGAQLTYQWISCNTYQVTVVLYGNCGISSSAAFGTLPVSTPNVCIYDGSTYFTTVVCTIVAPSAGVEVTPVCADSLASDACSIPTSSTPGIKKFVYTATVTLPHTSAVWRLVYNGDNGPGSPPGRAATITNLNDPGGTDMGLIDTLNNSATNTRGHNSSPELTVEPVPFFCANTESCYNPGAVDVYDTSHLDGEPSGDSLNFSLVAPENSSSGCEPTIPLCTYLSFSYCPGGTIPLSGSHPLQVEDCTPASFSFDPQTGQLCFNPVIERAVVVYNIDEYRTDTINNISTIAGTGLGAYGGDGAAATLAQIYEPAGVRNDGKGNVYLADYGNNRIRKINSAGNISTVAGNGLTGYCGDGAAATAANLNGPIGIATDTAGNVIFADANNNVVRKINVATGNITTVAGNGIAGFAGDGGGAAGTMNTYAGTGTPGFSGDGAAAIAADLQHPAGIRQDVAGNTYFSDYTNNRIRKVTPGGIISTIAGNSSLPGYCGDGGPGVAATLNNPLGLAVDPTGNVIFADFNNNAVRKINVTTGLITTIAGNGQPGFEGDGGNALGAITTFAGNGVPGFSGDGMTAIAAELQNPAGICQDGAGNTYFSDYSNNRIRMVSTAGLITTIAGVGGAGAYTGDNGPAATAALNGPQGLWIAGGMLYFADRNNNVVRKINLASGTITTVAGNGTAGYLGNGTPATAAELTHPNSVFVDAGGNIYITDGGNERIREVNAAGVISTIAGNGTAGFSGVTAITAELNNPYGLFVDATGNIYFADAGNNVIRVINSAGAISTFAGTGTPAFGGDGGAPLAASFNSPTDVFLDALGNVFVADRGNSCIREINAACNTVSTVAGTGATAGYSGDGLAPTVATLANPSFIYLNGGDQKIYISDYSNNRVRLVTPCELNHPTGVFVDNLNNTYISDAGNQRIRKIDPFGTITTIAGNGTAGFAGDFGTLASLPTVELNNPYGLYVDATGNIYFADAGNNRVRYITPTGGIYTLAGSSAAAYAGDGGPSTAASLNNPTDVFVDIAGNVLISDRGNSCIRKVSSLACRSIITTIAGRGGMAGYAGDGLSPDSAELNNPSFIHFNNASQDIYIADYSNNRVRVITPCELNHPTGVFVDQLNNTYISDAGNQRVRKISGSTGNITTIAGNGTGAYGGDGGPAISAQINNPYGLYVDGAGNVYIADANNNRIRKVNAAGIINTAIGSGVAGYAGDECSATSTTVELNGPTDVSLDPAGNMFIADKLNNRIRKVDQFGDLSTIAGTGAAGYGGDGGPSYLAILNNPEFLCLDTAKNIRLSDYGNNRVREIAYNSQVNRVMVGSMQREMTFTVLSCTNTTPTGVIDTFAGATRITAHDSTEVYACQNSGDVTLEVNPGEADTLYNITVTASGLNTGFTLGVVGDNTPHPHATVTVNTNVTAPGRYTFYLTYTDNHCPLVGTFTQPFTVDIYPVPSLTFSEIYPGNCYRPPAYLFTPGGYGLPWTIKISDNFYPFDTVQTFTNDTNAFVDSVAPGAYFATIFTSVSNICAQSYPINVIHPPLAMTIATDSVSYCGEPDGKLLIGGLPPGGQDTLIYKYGTGPAQFQGFVASFAGTDTVPDLHQGLYDSIVVQEGFCFTDSTSVNIYAPPYNFRTVTGRNPTKCGYSNGVDTVFGLHPGQNDTLLYRLIVTGPGGVNDTSYPTTSALVGTDSFVVFPGLPAGVYDSFQVHTFGVNNCDYVWTGAVILVSPIDVVAFTDTIHYGCSEDTIMFYNQSTAAPGDVLYYHWSFGDGTTDITADPMHIYNNTNNDTVNITLTASNLKCVDTLTLPAIMNNNVHANFAMDPSQYVCQLSPVAFTNLSTGVNPTYTWYYGDGDSDVVMNPSHTFTNSGTYTIKLVAADHVLPFPPYFTPCFDTATQTLAVDSTSSIKIDATDSVICSGQAITFTGVYAHIGDTGNVWTFGDGSSLTNVNPVQHSYDGEQTFTVTITELYRACAAQTTSRTVRVYTYPNLNLGADTSICPGSPPITISDNINATNPKATWLWNTGDSSSTIVVTKPGDYSTVVTIDGCSAYDTVIVQKDCYMDIPNAFTPNGDGTNDYFYPRQLLTKGLVTFKMDIYNRWGQLIYETTNIDGRGWDGTFNGSPQPQGVFVYMIEATFKDGQMEQHQGNVTLIR